MTEEMDVLKYIETMRLANFIGKFVLQRYQRALVQSFSKFQLDDMIKEDELAKNKTKVFERMSTSLNAGKDYSSDQQEFKRLPDLTDEQNDLLEEIDELFKPEENDADRCILYEVTQYQHESAPDNWWNQYDDYNELGCDNLVNGKRLNARAVHNKPDKRYCCGLIKAGGRLDIAAVLKDKTKSSKAAEQQLDEPILMLEPEDDWET